MTNTLIVSASVREPLPTNISHQATDLLTTNDLGNPSHMNIHTGTNDLEKLRTSQCISNYYELLKLVSDKHSSSKVIVSSLLIRADGIDK